MALFGTVCLFAMSKLPEDRFFEFLRLAVLVVVCAGTYALAGRVLGSEMLGLLIKGRQGPKSP
jgi:hypothetical protein